jgi:hypothetical protein
MGSGLRNAEVRCANALSAKKYLIILVTILWVDTVLVNGSTAPTVGQRWI